MLELEGTTAYHLPNISQFYLHAKKNHDGEIPLFLWFVDPKTLKNPWFHMISYDFHMISTLDPYFP